MITLVDPLKEFCCSHLNSVQTQSQLRAKQTLILGGSLDLSRPGDSINYQIPDLNTRSSKTKPLDNLNLIVEYEQEILFTLLDGVVS